MLATRRTGIEAAASRRSRGTVIGSKRTDTGNAHQGSRPLSDGKDGILDNPCEADLPTSAAPAVLSDNRGSPGDCSPYDIRPLVGVQLIAADSYGLASRGIENLPRLAKAAQLLLVGTSHFLQSSNAPSCLFSIEQAANRL
jgi:hypothetical protein